MLRSALALSVLLVPSAVPGSSGASQGLIAEADQKKISKEVQAYFTAKLETKGINDAFVNLTEAVDKAQKKIKDGHVLAQVADWEAILFQATVEEMEERVVKKGKVDKRTFEARSEEFTYFLHVPADYSPRKSAYPLVIVVGEPGKKPAEVLDTDWIDAGGRAKAILASVEMPEKTEAWKEFNPSDDVMDGISAIMFVFGDLVQNFAIDLNRVFLCGTSEGAGAALGVAQTFPHRFAGVIGRGAVPEVDATNFGRLPTLFVNGGTHASAFAEKAKQLGYENSTVSTGGTEAEVWAWIDATRRDAYPAKFAFTPRSPYSTKAYWIECEGVDVAENPVISVAVDQEKNEIKIDAERVGTIQVFLNDAIVDMEKAIKIVVNGKSHEQKLDRNLRTMIELAFKTSDWGTVFTGVVPITVPVRSN